MAYIRKLQNADSRGTLRGPVPGLGFRGLDVRHSMTSFQTWGGSGRRSALADLNPKP